MNNARILPRLIKQHFTDIPQRTAIVLQHAAQPDMPITYSMLVEGAYQYCRLYARQGVQPGDVIILILQHGKDLIFSLWGAILYGAIPSIMPFLTEKLSPERYRADITTLISVTQPAAIISYPEFEGEINTALPPQSSVRTVMFTNQLEETGTVDFDAMPGFQRTEKDIVLLQHSSGTTGLQKGVALSNQAVLNQLDAYGKCLTLTSQDVVISWLPLYHDMGLIAGFLMPVLSGITLVLQSPFDWVRAPHRFFQAVSQYKGTLAWLPNFSYNFCAQKIRARDLEGIDLRSLRAITNCSEPVKWESHQAFYNRFSEYGLAENTLQCSYAMAENVFAVTQTLPGSSPMIDDIDREAYLSAGIAQPPQTDHPVLRMMSSGKTLSNTSIRILNEHGHPLPDRVIGEILIHSDCMLTGYYNRSDITQKAFKEGWYRTGDLGYTLNGEVFISGRKKELIIVGGKNIYPQDIELLAYEVTGIHAGRAVVFGIFDEKTGTEEVAIVAEVSTEDVSERQSIGDKLRAHITKNSAIAIRYAHIVGPKWIIKTSSGKTARSANRDKFLQELQSE